MYKRLKQLGLIIVSSLLMAFPLVYLAHAATPVISLYPNGFPNSNTAIRITTGPDGALWYGGAGIGRITSSGSASLVLSQQAIPGANAIESITTGSDGNLWFTTEGDIIGQVTPAGSLTEYTLPSCPTIPSSGCATQGIASGSDGALWFTETQTSRIGRITTSGQITEYNLPTSNAFPVEITSGPDGALWFTENGTGNIGRITTAGQINEYHVSDQGSAPYGITSGPDGALWFTDPAVNNIGRISVSGVITNEYALPTSQGLYDITTGPDGNIWFTESGGNIGAITPSGSITLYPVTSSGSSVPVNPGITTGPDGNIWFTTGGRTSDIGKLSLLSAPSSPTNLTLTTPNPTNQSPGLSWTASASATSYNVYRNGGSAPIATNVTATSYTDTSAPQGTNTYDVTAVNSAGESQPSNSVSVIYDTVAPTITYSLSPTPNAGGWNTAATTVTFTCADPTSGVAISSCTAPVTLGNDGTNQQVTGTAVDNAGNTASVTATVNLDTTAPTITASVSQASGLPTNAAGWYNTPVTISYSCSDATSGISVCPSVQTESTDGQYTLSGTATDNAGNRSSVNTTANLDQTPPSVSSVALASSPLAMNTSTTLSAAVSDNLSGVNRVEYYVGTDPGQGNGTAMTYYSSTGTASAPFGPIAAPGSYTVYVRSQDNAGNWSNPQPLTFTVYPAATNISIVPSNETNTVGTTASFTATATDPSDNPVAGITVRYSVSGSVATSGSCVTDSTGTCNFSYTGPQLPGADLVDAYADNNTNGSQDQGEPSTNATVGWILPQNSLTSGDVQINGKYTASNGDKMHIVAHARNLNGSVSGTCNLIDQTANVAYSCTDATVMVENTATGQASIFGDITINGTATTYRIDVADNSAISQPDTFSFVTQSGYSTGGNLESGARVTVQ